MSAADETASAAKMMLLPERSTNDATTVEATVMVPNAEHSLEAPFTATAGELTSSPLPLLPPPSTVASDTQSIPALDLDNVVETYGTTPTRDLLRSLLVLRTTQVDWIVRISPALYRFTQRVPLLRTLTNRFIKHTFFRQFCGGETLDECRAYVERLQARGVGAILDYSVEGESPAPSNAMAIGKRRGDDARAVTEPPDEAPHEFAAQVLRNTVRWAGGDGHLTNVFCCLKVTALARFQLLEKVSEALAMMAGTMTTTHDGTPFMLLGHYTPLPLVDVISDTYDWAHILPPHPAKEASSLADTWPDIESSVSLHLFNRHLTPEERMEFLRLLHRLDSICRESYQHRIPMLIDAEQYSVQTAIDFCAGLMMLRYNRSPPPPPPPPTTTTTSIATDSPAFVYSTIQSYLKDSFDRLTMYRELASRYRFRYAIKQVRGAYMVSERRRAAAAGRPDLSPIHDTIDDTHASYNAIMSVLIDEVRAHRAAALFATHNGDSLQRAVELVGADWSVRRDPALRFAQLFGMGDSLTFGLQRAGFHAMKYVAFGRVHEVMPYLLRRLEENHSALGTAPRDLSHFVAELRRRDVRSQL